MLHLSGGLRRYRLVDTLVSTLRLKSDTRRVQVAVHATCPLPESLGSSDCGSVDQTPTAPPTGQQICAQVHVACPANLLWAILTDFESLPRLMPNLDKCERICHLTSGLPSTHTDAVLLRQKVFSQTVFWRVEASAVIEARMFEDPDTASHELRFRMLSGDFAELRGRWFVEPDASNPEGACNLCYEIMLVPTGVNHVPSALSVFLQRQSLPLNISAVAAHAEGLWQGRGSGVNRTLREQGTHPMPPRAPPVAPLSPTDAQDYAPGWVPGRRPIYLGVSSVPLPGQDPPSGAPLPTTLLTPSDTLGDTGDARTAAIQSQLRESGVAATPDALRPPYPPFEISPPPDDASCTADTASAVHVRRLDTDAKLHRRLVASVEVDAPASAIWRVLTDYERLADVVPVMYVSELVPPRRGRPYPRGMRRVRQLAAKRLPYLQLHTEVVLDVLEKAEEGGTRELQFRQHKSDFDVLQGKWIIGPGTAGKKGRRGKARTVLKYAVEMVIHAGPLRALGLIEPLLERGIVEDIPASLAAIKRVSEGMSVAQRRALVPRCLSTFEELRAELTRLYGDDMRLPNRQSLLSSGRVDLVAAIAQQGGYAQVAERLQWTLAPATRKPRGYWGDVENIRSEIDLLTAELGLEANTVPSKTTLRKLSRFDLIKAIERQGGTPVVARALEYDYKSNSGAVPRDTDTPESFGMQLLKRLQRTARTSGSGEAALPSVSDLLQGGLEGTPPSLASVEAAAAAAGSEVDSAAAAMSAGRRKMALNMRDMDRLVPAKLYPKPKSRRLSREEIDQLMSDTIDSSDAL